VQASGRNDEPTNARRSSHSAIGATEKHASQTATSCSANGSCRPTWRSNPKYVSMWAGNGLCYSKPASAPNRQLAAVRLEIQWCCWPCTRMHQDVAQAPTELSTWHHKPAGGDKQRSDRSDAHACMCTALVYIIQCDGRCKRGMLHRPLLQSSDGFGQNANVRRVRRFGRVSRWHARDSERCSNGPLFGVGNKRLRLLCVVRVACCVLRVACCVLRLTL
jgi:hypothetical protein